jgi:hypothetical protein
VNLARLRKSPQGSSRNPRKSNQLDGHTINRTFDVSATELLALSATGFGAAEAMPHRA